MGAFLAKQVHPSAHSPAKHALCRTEDSQQMCIPMLCLLKAPLLAYYMSHMFAKSSVL